MARTVDQINSYMVDAFVSNMGAIGVTIDPTLWSKRNFFRLVIYTCAIGQALLEQLMDAFMATVDAKAQRAAAASRLWIQAKMFQFQYSVTDPQFVIMINAVPQYPVIDLTLNIITACSVTSEVSNAVTVKVAQTINGVLAALDNNMQSAAQGYLNTIGTAGIDYTVQSKNPDQLYVVADLYFQGQYSPVIQATTIAALTAWLQQQSVINFDGKIKMSDLENTLRAVPGMNDVVLRAVRGRADADSFNSGIDLILNSTEISRAYTTNAGYMIPETTATKTLADTLNFISE